MVGSYSIDTAASCGRKIVLRVVKDYIRQEEKIQPSKKDEGHQSGPDDAKGNAERVQKTSISVLRDISEHTWISEEVFPLTLPG